MEDNLPLSDKVFLMESRIINEISEKEDSFILVGRCGNYILEDKGCFSVYIYSDPESRVKRAVEDYGIAPNKAEHAMKKADKRRETFYNVNTGKIWQDKDQYHLCLNSRHNSFIDRQGGMKLGIILLRSLILYLLVIFAVRLMGKRQLGELQPSELVITILVSNIATLPIEDVNIPVIIGVTPILALVCFEVIMSWLILKFPPLRKIVSGGPKVIIRDGVVDVHPLSELRLSVDDLMTAVRGCGIFDLSEVQFAMVETTGSFSVMKKQGMESPTRRDMSVSAEAADPPMLIVSDGKMLEHSCEVFNMEQRDVEKFLRSIRREIGDILLMAADEAGNCYIAWKNGDKPLRERWRVGDDKSKDKCGDNPASGGSKPFHGNMD